jgi:hypothetical protein
MKCPCGLGALRVLLGTFLLSGFATTHPQRITASPERGTLTVTAVPETEGTPAIPKTDVQLFVDNERRNVADWEKDDNLFLAILIDDSIDPSAANHWGELKEFILAQPASVHIAVGYLRDNWSVLIQDFTTDHRQATKALRLPMGGIALGSSPYLATIDFLKSWPQTGPHRSILLISSGIDFFRGRELGPIYPDVPALVEKAAKQNTNIWTVYYPSSGHRRSVYRVYHAQNNLGRLSEQTGAESYYLGHGAPVSLEPYLDEIAWHLSNQYLLRFTLPGGTKGKYQTVKVKTETSDVELFASNLLYLPASK